MQSVRALARQSLRMVGLEKIHHPSFVNLILHEQIETVLDVGANEGHYGADLRERGFSGRIVSFEPIGTVFDTLAARTAPDPLWEAHRLGVGNQNEARDIAVTAAHVFSSFKPATDYTAKKFVGAQVDRSERVQVVRLDTFLADHPAYLKNSFLKIDTQGFEREVLEGAGALLQSFRAVQLELPLRQLYQGQDSWLSMVQWMAERGFEIAMAKENGFDWDAMRLLELDVVFVRT